MEQQFLQKGISVNPEWLRSHIVSGLTTPQVFQKWVDTRLEDSIIHKCNRSQLDSTDDVLNDIIVEIRDIIDVGSSAFSQLTKLKDDMTTQRLGMEVRRRKTNNPRVELVRDSSTFDSTSTRRCLTLYISDGIMEVKAMEHTPIKELNRFTPPGTKLRVRGCERIGNTMLLTQSNIQVLGQPTPRTQEPPEFSYMRRLCLKLSMDPQDHLPALTKDAEESEVHSTESQQQQHLRQSSSEYETARSTQCEQKAKQQTPFLSPRSLRKDRLERKKQKQMEMHSRLSLNQNCQQQQKSLSNPRQQPEYVDSASRMSILSHNNREKLYGQESPNLKRSKLQDKPAEVDLKKKLRIEELPNERKNDEVFNDHSTNDNDRINGNSESARKIKPLGQTLNFGKFTSKDERNLVCGKEHVMSTDQTSTSTDVFDNLKPQMETTFLYNDAAIKNPVTPDLHEYSRNVSSEALPLTYFSLLNRLTANSRCRVKAYLVQIKSKMDKKTLELSAEFDDGTKRMVLDIASEISLQLMGYTTLEEYEEDCQIGSSRVKQRFTTLRKNLIGLEGLIHVLIRTDRDPLAFLISPTLSYEDCRLLPHLS
eukprot:CFRG5442T1